MNIVIFHHLCTTFS